jgi:predicted GIY-YIG superfamily endonuclease
LYELTHNKKNCYNQSQLAMLIKVPDANHLRLKRPVEVCLAPPGCKSLPISFTTTSDLMLTHGWTKTSVGLSCDRIHCLPNGIQAKRHQYGLRPRIASTIHGAMGQDLPAIVTKVTMMGEETDYNLWLKEQVIVLLSRTHFAKDIIFVGDPHTTSRALAECLGRVSQFSDYMSHIMKTLSTPPDPETLRHSLVDPFKYSPYRMSDYTIPSVNGSFCYNLVSLGDPTHSTTYIGETKNLAHRFALHNQRMGAQTTKDIALIPWGLMGFVTGFEGESAVSQRKKFERDWQAGRNVEERRRKRKLHPEEIRVIAQLLISRSTNDEYAHLTYVRCGSMEQGEDRNLHSVGAQR